MTLQQLEQRFSNTRISDEEIEDLVQEEVEDMLEDYSRKEIVEEIEDMDEEFQDLVMKVVDEEIMLMYSDQFDEDAKMEENFEETLESLQRDYTIDEIVQMASEQSSEFREKVREELE